MTSTVTGADAGSHDPGQPRLPPGQRAIDHLPRFGLSPFATRFPREPHAVRLEVGGDVHQPLQLDAAAWAALPRHEQASDLHCVTTWSRCGLRWSGVRFRDLYARVVQQHAAVDPAALTVSLHAQDGYRATLPLQDLLADDVLIADRLDGAPLPIAHGAPLRLVAPAHYGYKNVKHLKRVLFHRDAHAVHPVGLAWMAHPRGRVALEERGQHVPGWLLRWLYRPMIGPTAARFARELQRHLASGPG